jgi:hypothetical protein
MAKKKLADVQKTLAGTKKTQKNWQIKTWTQIGKLADEALRALQADNVQAAGEFLRAIRGVALTAEQDGL